MDDISIIQGGGCSGQSSEPLPPRRQAVVERLRRRIEGYRRHQSNCVPRFEQTFNGVVDQNLQDTLMLKQRFIENKPKRPVKKTEKKPAENASIQNNISLPKFQKCNNSEESSESFNDSSKPQQKHEDMSKFPVDMAQQLEFTAPTTNSQISSNVKSLSTSVKGDVPNSPSSPRNINIIECKREPENIEFVDLEQCAAALEKDAAANGGNSFPGFSDLIGDGATDAISSDTFKNLISEISEYTPELMMKEFDFNNGENRREEQKIENVMKPLPVSCANSPQPQMNHQRLHGTAMDMPKAELPAAQTLKNMAEQHQHKAQMGIGFTRLPQKPYEFQYSGTTEYIGQSLNQNNYKVNSPYSTEGIKQETFSAQNSPVGYANSPTGKTPSPQRMTTQYKPPPQPQPPPQQQQQPSQPVYQFSPQMSPQYRLQQPMKIDYSKTVVSHHPGMISYSQAGMLQAIPPSGPMLRAPQPQYLPRYSTGGVAVGPRASYTKAPRLAGQEPTWLIQRPLQVRQPHEQYLSEAQLNQLQISEARAHHQLQASQLRAQPQAVSLLNRVGASTLSYSSAYTSANMSYVQSNFNIQQSYNHQSAIAPEFSLDFLEHIPHSDVPNFSDQELFSSLESGTNFNFPDIL